MTSSAASCLPDSLVGDCGFFKAAARAPVIWLYSDERGSGAVSEEVGACHCLPFVVGAIGGYGGSGTGVGGTLGGVSGLCMGMGSRPMSYKS